MEKVEFEKVITPRVNNGIGGGVSDKMWKVINEVYMTTSLAKEQVADIFWNRTGLWSEIEAAVKKHLEADKRFSDAMHLLIKTKFDYTSTLREMDSIVNFYKTSIEENTK